MRFIVDEMPYWETDCPFYDPVTRHCKIDNSHCDYFDSIAGERLEEDCAWLTTSTFTIK